MIPRRLLDFSYGNITGISGPLLFARRASDVAFGATVQITGEDGPERLGQVLDLSEDLVVIQVMGSTHGLSPRRTRLRYSDSIFRLPLSRHMLGRVLDGKGLPIDGGLSYPALTEAEIAGSAINPLARAVPDEYVETGVSAIDLMNTLVKGQKLPIFSCAGLPSNELASFIVRNASAAGSSGSDLIVVFAGMGVTHRDVTFFLETFRAEGAMDRTVVFLNRADEPVIERLMAPRCALTAAEYFAFDLGFDVLVILTDMTHYCEALREVASAREEISGRRGYPGHMYTDLASLYERAGRILGRPGSVTQLPIVTMPDDDITHPIPDLTGYVTEGQIVLDRSLHRKGIDPPINPLLSLSRLMDKAAGRHTPKEHKSVSDQLYSLYARAIEVRRMAELVGEDNLSGHEKELFRFGDRFEQRILNQGGEARTLAQSLDAALDLLAGMPAPLLGRVRPELLEARGKRGEGGTG